MAACVRVCVQQGTDGGLYGMRLGTLLCLSCVDVSMLLDRQLLLSRCDPNGTMHHTTKLPMQVCS